MENIDFWIQLFSAAKNVTKKFQLDDSNEGRYVMILARDLLAMLGLDIIFYKHVIIGIILPYEGCSTTMVVINNHYFNSLTGKTIEN